jgi:modulator of FtsH protease HflK
MPWSNQNGPWAGGPGRGQSPWTQPPGEPSDFEARVRRWGQDLKGWRPNRGNGALFWIAGAIVVALWFASGLYTVGPNEVGLNMTFGRFTSQHGPGLAFNWPFPVGSVIKPAVTDRNSIDIGFAPEASSRTSDASVEDVPAESLMLTGDQNIADVKFRVVWQIDPTHPEEYAFDVANPRETVKAVAESAMREIVGRTPIQGLLTADRSQIEPAAQDLIQNVLNHYRAGVLILQVQLLPIDPPDQVIAAFKDVTVAQQDKDRLQNEAETYANKVVPEARGQAAKIVQDAEAYRSRTVAEATGEAAAFDEVYASYLAAPDITRQRIYIETMQKILAGASKTILDSKGGPPVAPYLPLTAPTSTNGENK